ncbi:MAG: hypothetical protein ACI9EF_003977, partial [Pseudohongiellaceae bacterium]
MESPVVRALEPDVLRQCMGLVPDWISRYHDELEFLAPDNPAHPLLAHTVRSQIRVLVEY